MLLSNIIQADTGATVNLKISDGRIEQVLAAPVDNITYSEVLYFDKAIVFPGLINSHDHLDFNLFPQLGSRIYKNYSEWGAFILEKYKNEIAAILKVPQALRSQWGMYKNLLCGVTTVVNHGSGADIQNKLINIFDEKHDLHSVGFDKRWQLRLNNPLKKHLPVVIHAGEGTDAAARDEIDKLLRWNLLSRDIIAVHGVAMQLEQSRYFKALVWCPESNYFLLNQTAPVNELKLNTRILFGTDSTLTGNWNIFDHIQFARETGLLTDDELYKTLNHNPAQVWGINAGEIAAGRDADLVIARMKDPGSTNASFFALTPADLLLVMQKGNIRLFDEELLNCIKGTRPDNFSKIYIDGACKYVQGDLPGLMEQIQAHNPGIKFPVNIRP